MKRRKVHPADAANAAVLAQAVRFDVALFLGTGRYARASALSLEDARIEAMRLVAENPTPFARAATKIVARLPRSFATVASAVCAPPSAGLA